MFADFYRFFGLSWETSPQTDLTPEASKRPESRTTESTSTWTTFRVLRFLERSNLKKKSHACLNNNMEEYRE